MTKTDLTISELFHKHKRNLLITCSIAIAFWVVNAPQIKLAAIGEDPIDARKAAVLLLFAITYFAAQFGFEAEAVIARNTSTAAGADSNTIDAQIQQHLTGLTNWVHEPHNNMEELKLRVAQVQRQGVESLERFDVNAEHQWQERWSNMERTIQLACRVGLGPPREDPEWIKREMATVFKVAREAFEAWRDGRSLPASPVTNLDTFKERQQDMHNVLERYTNEMTVVGANLNKISRSIRGRQRASFYALDIIAPACLTLLAVAACFARIFGWSIDSSIPLLPGCLYL